MLPLINAAIALALAIQFSRVPVEGATCGSVNDVSDPISLHDSTGWIRQDMGAGGMLQGHISTEMLAWNEKYIVVYGGTTVRTDDVNDVFAVGSNVSILDISSSQNWTLLEMVGEALSNKIRQYGDYIIAQM